MTNSERHVIIKYKSLSSIAGIIFGFFTVSLLTWYYLLKLSLDTAYLEALDWVVLLSPIAVMVGLVCTFFLQLNKVNIYSSIKPSLDMAKDLKGLIAELTSIKNIDDQIELVSSTLYHAFQIDYVSVFIRIDSIDEYGCRFAEGNRMRVDTIMIPSSISVMRTLQAKSCAELMDVDIAEHLIGAVGVDRLSFSELPFKVKDKLFPIYSSEGLYGFLVLGSSRLYSDLGELERILIESLCVQLGNSLKLKELESNTKHIQKLASLGTMSAGLSHELSNSMVSIKTMASLLNSDPKVVVTKTKFCQTFKHEVTRMSGILNGVAAYARDQQPTGTVDLSEVVKEVENCLDARLCKHGVKLNVQFDAESHFVVGDFVQLVQVFYNIMENAFNAITEWESRPEIGHINIHVHYNNSTINDELNKIEISISDNGPGIAQAAQRNIFNPFFTSRDSKVQFEHFERSVGTGLGLSIVRQIIELHRGHISVCSELGHGTTFRICMNSVS